MISTRRTAPLVAVLASVATLAACASGTTTKSGGDAVTILRMVDGYSSFALEPSVGAFVDDVNRRSGGRLKIEVTHRYGDFAPDFEQRVVRSVAAGEFDLGWTGTRVYDTLGVTSFQALTAPLLIDSYPLQDAVFRSPIPSEMLPGLEPLGVTGLAVLAGGLRKPIAVARPLRGLRDWHGLTVSTLRSTRQAQTIRALGATPTDVLTSQLDEGLQRGTINGFEKNLLIYAENHSEPAARYVTANVNLWPETAVLLANPASLGRLGTQQAGWIRAAASEASGRSATLADADQSLVAERCARGARFAMATSAELAALQTAVAPVITDLKKDPTTKASIDRILALKRAVPAPSSLQIPPGCTDASAPGTATPSATRTLSGPAARLPGTWLTVPLLVERTRGTFQKFGATRQQLAEFDSQLAGTSSIQYGLEITDTTWRQFEVRDGGRPETGWSGTYTLDGSTVHANGTGACRIDYRVTIAGDELQLNVLSDDGPSPDCGPTDLFVQRMIHETAPFRRAP